MSSALTAIPAVTELDAQRNYATMMARFDGLPDHYRGKPQAILWAIARADADGTKLATFMEHSYPLPGGRIGTSADYKLGLAKRRVPDFHVTIVERSDQRCVLEGWRGDGPHVKMTYTAEMAQARGLLGKDNYIKSRADMLYHRCSDRLVKLVCPDAMIGDPRDDDETSDAPASAPVDRPASGAVVLDGPTPGEPVQPAEAYSEPVEIEDGAAAAASKPVPIDWLGRLLNAIREHYGPLSIKTEPPNATPGRNKWVKTYQKYVGQIVVLFYGDRDESAPENWQLVPEMDYEKMALWLEGKMKKRTGEAAGGRPVADPKAGESQSVAPSVATPEDPSEIVAEGAPEEGETPADPEPEIVTGWQALVPKGHLHLTNVLLAMRHATKNAREFARKSPKGNYELVDGDILGECGFVNAMGTPVSQWLHKLQEGVVWNGQAFLAPSEQVWPMTCKAVYDEAQRQGVATI